MVKAPTWKDLPKDLQEALLEASHTGTICPPIDLMFRAFEMFPLDQTKVVILGQDPYHTPGKASGLAFAYNNSYTGPLDSSLANILSEVRRDTGHLATRGDFTLGHWAKQGVLLLNTRLSVLEGRPLSHKGLGWEQVIIGFLKELDKHVPGKVYMLWGKEAQSYKKHLDEDDNQILETSHPCKFSAHRGFNGCGHFTIANAYLRGMDRGEIEW